MASSVIKIAPNDFDADISIPDSMWTIPSDGYIRVVVTQANAIVRVRIYGSTSNDYSTLITTVYDSINNAMGCNTVFVRVGMRAQVEAISSVGASARFVPIK